MEFKGSKTEEILRKSLNAELRQSFEYQYFAGVARQNGLQQVAEIFEATSANELEHARHEYIKTLGLNFTALHEQGVDMVVVKLEMAFKTPLKSNDTFMVTVTMKKEGIRWIFLQDIQRLPDHKMVVRARVDAVAVVNGKLTDYKPLDEAFGYKQ